MNKVYIINVECRLYGEIMYEVLNQGFNTFEKARDYVLDVLVPDEKENSWIKNYKFDELKYKQAITPEDLHWECSYNDYEKYTSINVEEITII